MEVVVLKSFYSDIKKLKDKKIKSGIIDFIKNLQNTDTLEEISNIKKLKGHSTAYRWRIGDYRLGFYKEKDKIELSRLVKRNDIYKLFP